MSGRSLDALTLAELRVLRALFDGEIEHYGLALGRRSGIRTGSLVPLLQRLEARGLVASRLEDGSEQALRRRRRRYYSLTRRGGRLAQRALVAVATELVPPGWTVEATPF